MLNSQYQLTGSACSQVGYFQIATLLMLFHILKSDKLTAGTQTCRKSRRNTTLVVSDNNHKHKSAAASTILAA
jgi:hypothetical protein